MKTSVKFSKILAVILTARLMLTLLTANVFATEGTGEGADVTAEVTGEATGESTDAGEVTTDEHGHDHDHDETTADPHAGHDHGDEESNGVNWVDIIISASILVLGAIAFTICYFVIPKFRDRVKKFFSDYKSELAKITWSSKEDVRKNTITAVVVIAVVAIVVCLLDVIFSGGIEALSHLI